MVTIHRTDSLVILWLEIGISCFETLLELFNYHKIVEVLCSQLGFRLLFRSNLLLFELFYFELELVEVESSFFFRSVEFLPMERFKASVLLNPLLQIGLILC